MSYDRFFKAAKKAKNPSASFRVKQDSKPSQESPEAVLRAMLQQRVKSRSKQRPRTPWAAAIAAGLGAIIAGVGIMQPELFEKALTKVEIGWLGKSLAAEGAPAKASQSTAGSK